MFRAELPPSVSTEYTPELFGAGTRTFKHEGYSVHEVYSDRRRAGTSLRSRILHVSNASCVTTMVLSPGDEYQTIEIAKVGEPIMHAIGVNGTHLKLEAINADSLETVESINIGYGDTPMHELMENVETQLSNTTLPSKLSEKSEAFFKELGEIIKQPQRYLPIPSVIALSHFFSSAH